MEENKTTKGTTPSKPSYEQLEYIAQMLQKRYAELEQKLQQIDNVFTRLNYLFNVLDRAKYFKEDFVKACAEEIQNILDTRNTETESE